MERVPFALSALFAIGAASACGDSARPVPPSWRPPPNGTAPIPDAGAADSSRADGGPRSLLGSVCQSDSDCPAGASCLETGSGAIFGGGPPQGTCVATCDPTSGCSAFADAVCIDVDDPAVAGDAGHSGAGLCFERCAVGDGSASKCHGRTNVACAPVEGAASGGYCRPVCVTNADCPSGACDPALGVCVTGASPDTTFGLRCGPADVAPDAGDAGEGKRLCPDVCVALDSSASVCSRRCVFGSTTECAPASGGLRRGGCLFVTQGGGIGDLGYCGELCDCTGDCAEPTFVCDAFGDASLESAFGRKGVCTPMELVVNRPIPCGD